MGIAVSGLVSGMDSASIISKLMELERKPITLLENKRTTLANEKAAWQEVSSKMLALETAAKDLSTPSKFASMAAKYTAIGTTSASAVSISADSTATEGSYSISVYQLAQAQKSASDQSFSSASSALGLAGTITINGSTNISVSATDTLEEIKNNITNSGAGVKATIFNAGTFSSPQYRLMVTGDDVGSAAAFSITYNDFTLTDNILSFSQTQAAQDANIVFDGISVTKASNSVSDLISGATINLSAVGSGTITMSTDQDSIVKKAQAFVDKYNALMDYMKTQLTYDQADNKKEALFGNATLMTMQNQLRSIVSGTVPGLDPTDTATFSSLSQIGIKTDLTNQLSLDTTAFRDALTNRFNEVSRIFASGGSGTYTYVSSTGFTQGGKYDTKVEGGILKLRLQGTSDWISLTQSGNYAYGETGTALEGLLLRTGSLTEGQTGTMTIMAGVASRVESHTGRYTEFSTEGLIYNQNKSIEDRDKEFQKQISSLNERLTKKEEALKTKFANLEVLLAKMNSQQQYLNQQLNNLKTNYK